MSHSPWWMKLTPQKMSTSWFLRPVRYVTRGKGLFRTLVMKAINQLVLIKEVCLVSAATGFRCVEHGMEKPAKNTRLLPSITGGQ